MKQFYLIGLLIFILVFSVKAQEIVCGSVCGSCNIPHSNNPPNPEDPATPAIPGEFYTQVFNLYNNSSIYASNVALIADRAYFNNGSTDVLDDISYQQASNVYFSIPSWECEEVQLDFSINPNESGYYKIYYKMYIGSEELSTLPDGDLWVDITVDVLDCSPPANLNVPPPNVTSNSAQVTFTTATGANSTNIYWTPSGTSNWQSLAVSGNQTVLTGLISNTEYVVQAASNCGSNTSDYTSHVYFTTSSSSGGSCDAPNGLYTNDIGTSFARLNWNSVSGVNAYNVRYRQSGGAWTYEERNTTEYFIQNLISSQQYEWQVASYCYGEMSDWSVSSYFTTNCTTPDASFSVSKNIVSIGEEFNLNDLSTNTPTSWNWYIEDGATSSYSIEDPTNVSCTSAGIKDITLSVTNDCGSDDASTTITVNSDYGNQPHDISDTRDHKHFNKKVGDPVDPFTGEYSLPFTLFSIRGMGSEYDFTITHNSLIDTKTDIGWNWQRNYFYELEDSGDLWTITDGTGKQQFFVPYGDASLPLYADEKDAMYKDGSLYILERTNGHKVIFTSSTILQQIADRNGNRISPVFNSSNQLTNLKFPGGRYLLLYYTDNLLTKITDRANRSVYLNYNAYDELEKITNVDGSEFIFYYNTLHQITSIKDAKGNFPVTNVYNSDNKVELQTDAENNIIEFAYNNPITNATRITNSEGNYSYYYHNSHGELTKFIDEEGFETSYAINDLGKPSRITNAMSDTVWLTYDSDENLTSIETPTHSSTALEYGNFRLPTKIIDPLGNNTTISYDAKGNRKQQNLANGSIITETVDEYGRVLTSQHQNKKTTFDYNNANNAGGDLSAIYDDDNNDYYLDIKVKTGFINKVYDRNDNNIEYAYNFAGMVTYVEYDDYTNERFAYDGNYNLIHFINRNGDTTHYEWYKNDLLKSVTNALGQTTSIEYYLTTYPKKYTYPDGRTDVLTYFKNGWLKSITDDMGTISYTYQANGEIATVTDRMNRTSSMAYDKDGRLTSITNPLGQVNQLAYNDRDLVSASNAAGDATTYEYGNMGQFTKANDPLNNFNLMAYDDLMNVTSITDANGHQTTIAYNNRSLPSSITLPTNDVFSTTYDNEALVKTFTDANGITATIYRNSNNQIKDIYYSNSEWSGLQYYPNGQLKKIQNNNSEQNFQYDKIGQLTQETGAFSEIIQYVYDPVTNYLTQVIYPGNKTITYSYSKGLISELQDWNGNWAKYEYTNSSALQKVTYSNGIITNYTIDDLDQITEQLSYKGSDTICYYHLTRDSRNLIVKITEKQPIMPAFAYKSAITTFDEADRPQSGGGSIFTNDANGNLLSFIDDTDTIGYSYAENNRITQSSYNGETITREYNALRKPVKLTKNGIETRYTFSNGLGLSKPIQQRDGSNNITQHYVYGADGLAWMVDNNGDAHFYNADYIGNIIAITNNAGAITDSLANDPWGGSVAQTGNTEQPFGYMGKYGIIHLGSTQYIVGARDYVGALGRFVSADEYPANLSNTQSNQRYSMAYNSPYNFVDPSGYLPKFATGGQKQSQAKQPARKIQLIENNFNWKKALWDSFVENATDPEVLIDGVHNGFDAAGLVPGLGEIADGINAGIYALEGDKINAGLSTAAMIPFAGWGATGAKHGRKAVNTKISVHIEQYALKAAKDGFYPIMRRGLKEPQAMTYLKRGDIWKFGTTKNPSKRYSQNYLNNTGAGLRYSTEFSGTLQQSLHLENLKILNYKLNFRLLPPGNKIIK